MVAKTLFGFEEILAKELQIMGAQNVQKGLRMVSFEGDKGFMYKTNLALRTAIKILKPIHQFRVTSQNSLYDGIAEINWSEYFSVDNTFAIDTVVYSTFFNNSQFVAFKAKDAIIDQFRKEYGRRPNIDTAKPDIQINIHIQHDKATVSLDASGDSLHHRGYRTATNIAPINEVLAAGMVLLSEWNGQCDFLDPMCGSGTILIEAAMIACNIPANLNRKHFSFQNWKDWDPELYDKIRESLLKKIKDPYFSIKGYDKAPSAVQKAKDNIKNANLEDFITVERKDFFESEKVNAGPLHLLFNPPYGERLNVEMEEFYAKMGDTFKKKYPNTNAWLITGNIPALKHVGLKAAKKIPLLNAGLEAILAKYEIYEGSKKKRTEEE
ncbi:MAG: class I SAM-dependent RNA methyltransferase [Bacteroidia bacterium]|nr:class I SAM-dependent RNA methyltransferase [Bacteroidia bacterium]